MRAKLTFLYDYSLDNMAPYPKLYCKLQQECPRVTYINDVRF
jgi:hypothetical protein